MITSIKFAVFGTQGAGKTTLVDGLQGKFSADGRYVPTTKSRKVALGLLSDRQDVVFEAMDIPGDDLIFPSLCNAIIPDARFVVFLVSALDLMRGKAVESGARLRYIKCEINKRPGQPGLILLLTHKRDFIQAYGESHMSEVLSLAHRHFDKYTDKGYELFELVDPADVDDIRLVLLKSFGLRCYIFGPFMDMFHGCF